MKLDKFYEAVGGNHAEVQSRLINDRLILKFLLKFPEDPSYGVLCVSMDHGDFDEAFRAVHTLKGVCLNLGLSKLADSAIAMTELLRTESGCANQAELGRLMNQIKQDYVDVIDAIHGLR